MYPLGVVKIALFKTIDHCIKYLGGVLSHSHTSKYKACSEHHHIRPCPENGDHKANITSRNSYEYHWHTLNDPLPNTRTSYTNGLIVFNRMHPNATQI